MPDSRHWVDLARYYESDNPAKYELHVYDKMKPDEDRVIPLPGPRGGDRRLLWYRWAGITKKMRRFCGVETG
jgi:hypothetical protein